MIEHCSGINLMLIPKSHKALTNLDDLILQGIVKALRSSYFCMSEHDVIVLKIM